MAGPGMQPPPARAPQQPLHSAAQMMMSEASIKSEDMHGPHAMHADRLSVAPLNVGPMYAPTRPRGEHSASAPLPGQPPGPDKDLAELWQLLAPEAAPQEQLNLCGGNTGSAPNMSTYRFSTDHSGGIPPPGQPPAQQQQLHPGDALQSCTAAPAASTRHPGAAAHARMHREGRGIGEAYAAVDDLCPASFSFRSGSSPTVSLSDMPPVLSSKDGGPHGLEAAPVDAVRMHECASECGWGPPNPASPPPLLLQLNSGVLDCWSADMPLDPAAPGSSRQDMFAGLPGGLRRRRQSSNATMQAPLDGAPSPLSLL